MAQFKKPATRAVYLAMPPTPVNPFSTIYWAVSTQQAANSEAIAIIALGGTTGIAVRTAIRSRFAQNATTLIYTLQVVATISV